MKKALNNLGTFLAVSIAILVVFLLAFLPLYTLVSGFMRATGGL